MLKHLPKIILSSAAFFGMLNSIMYIGGLSNNTAVSGVEEVLPLRLFDWGSGVAINGNYSSFISFALIGGVCASFISRKKQLSLRMTVLLIIGVAIFSGTVLGNIQNQIVSNIGHSLVTKYPGLADRAISTYYVQRITARDNNYKNTLIPAYAGDNANSIESMLFIVNMFYLVDDPIVVVGDRVRGQDLMKIYFADAVDNQAKYEDDIGFRNRWKFKEFFDEYQTPHYDLRRISNTVVLPVVLASTMIGLILSTMIFFAQIIGLGGGHWVKIRFYAIAGLALTVLSVPLFINTEFHSSPGVKAFQCRTTYCDITKPVMDWFFRFELGVVNLINLAD